MSTVCGSGSKGCHDSSSITHQSIDSPFELEYLAPHHLLICCSDNTVSTRFLWKKKLYAKVSLVYAKVYLLLALVSLRKLPRIV